MRKLRKISKDKLDTLSSSGTDQSYVPTPAHSPITPSFGQITPISPVPYTMPPTVKFSISLPPTPPPVRISPTGITGVITIG